MWSRRELVRAMLTAGVVVSAPRVAWADDLELTLTLSASETQVGKGVYLEVEISESRAGNGALDEPEFPAEGLDGLSIVRRGSSFNSSFSMVNGRSTSTTSRTYKYLIMPKAPGTYRLDVKVGDQSAAVVPVLKVSGKALPAPPSIASGDRPETADTNVFLWPSVSKEKVYVGEGILYRLELWEKSSGELSMNSLPSFKDFYAEDMPSPAKRSDRVGRMSFRVHPLMTRVLFPQRAGELGISGGEVLVTPSEPFGLLMRRRRADPPYTVSGPPRTIEVLPLPAKGQPAGFSPNNVGRYEISASVDRTSLVQGEALKLTVTIEGLGNIRVLDPGDWPALDGLRRYDPKVSVEAEPRGQTFGGKRIYEFLLVAEESGTLRIPAHELSMFDPNEERYLTVSTEPIEVVVTPDPDAARPAEAAPEEPEEGSLDEDDELLADVLTPATLPRTERAGPWLSPGGWLRATLAIPLGLGMGAGIARLRAVLGPDEQARARSVRRRARHELVSKLGRAVSSGADFHPMLAELLHTSAVHRAGPDAVGLPRPRLLELLRERGVPVEQLDALEALLEECDAARFGGGESGPEGRREQLERTLELLAGPGWRDS